MEVNGKRVELREIISLQAFLLAQGYDVRKVAVELNGNIVPKSSFDAVTLTDDADLEIVSFVGGG